MKFRQDLSNYQDEKTYHRQNGKIQFNEYHFSEDAQGIAMKMHETLVLTICFQSKPQNKNFKNCFDFHCTIILDLSNQGESCLCIKTDSSAS